MQIRLSVAFATPRLCLLTAAALAASTSAAFAQDRGPVAIAVSFLLIVVAPTLWALTIFSWRKHREVKLIERQMKDWPTVQGQVLSSDVEVVGPWTDLLIMLLNIVTLFTPGSSPAAMGGSTYWPRIHYRYSVAGNTYDGDRIQFTPKSFGRRDRADEAIAPYPAGAEVTVHYMPQDPSIAVLRTDRSRSFKLHVLFGLSIVVTAIVVYYYVF